MAHASQVAKPWSGSTNGPHYTRPNREALPSRCRQLLQGTDKEMAGIIRAQDILEYAHKGFRFTTSWSRYSTERLVYSNQEISA